MRFFIADDDRAIRSILGQIIEDEDLGEVVDEADDGIGLEAHSLNLKKVDILLIDLLMPARDGIQTIRHIHPEFKGKVIMISQVEAKEMMAEAYELGIEYYIHKPVNIRKIICILFGHILAPLHPKLNSVKALRLKGFKVGFPILR